MYVCVCVYLYMCVRVYIFFCMYNVQCTMYTVHCTVYTVHCTVYSSDVNLGDFLLSRDNQILKYTVSR